MRLGLDLHTLAPVETFLEIKTVLCLSAMDVIGASEASPVEGCHLSKGPKWGCFCTPAGACWVLGADAGRPLASLSGKVG